MSVDIFLSRLAKVKRTGSGRWIARCPAHNDRSPSLSIRELDDGRVLLHCFAGCDVLDVLSAVAMDISALFPKNEMPHGKPERRPFPAIDVLRAVAFEALVVMCAATAMLAGEPFTPTDRARLVLASARLQAALTAAGVQHG